MNHKTYSILFCALLASTFVHELKAKDLIHQRHHDRSHHSGHLRHAGHSRLHSHSQNRASTSSDQDCQYVCTKNSTGGNGGGLQIVVNANASIIAIVNVTANVAVALDVNANVTALFNGNTGQVVVIDLSTQTGVYVTLKVSTLVWVASKISFTAYVAQLTTLKVFLSISGAVSINVSSVSSDILTVVNQIVIYLISGIQLEINNNSKVGLQILLQVVIKLQLGITTYLGGKLSIFEDGKAIDVNVDLIALVNIIVGVGVVLRQAGEISVLIEKGLHLDIGFWSSGSGIVLLINLFLKLHGIGINIGVVYSVWLNDVVTILIIIGQLGGGTSSGAHHSAGLIILLAYIIAKLQGKSISAEIIASLLLQIAAPAIGVAVSLDVIIAELKGFQEIVKLLPQYASAFKALIEFVVAISAEKLIIASIDVYKILTLIVKSINAAVEDRLAIIVQIAVTLAIVNTLVLAIFVHIGTATGINILLRIGIQIESLAKVVAEVVVATPKILFYLGLGQFTKALNCVASLAKILTVITKALASVNLTIAGVLGNQLSVLVNGLFSVVLGVSVSVSSAAKTTIQTLLNLCSFKFVFGVDVHFNIAAGAAVAFSS